MDVISLLNAWACKESRLERSQNMVKTPLAASSIVQSGP